MPKQPKRRRSNNNQTSSWFIDSHELIPLVECRPFLFSRTAKGFSCKMTKFKAWKEIARSLSSDWNTLTTAQKFTRCREVQARWKNLRDNFRRDFQRRASGGSTKQKYRYSDALSFLVPSITAQAGTSVLPAVPAPAVDETVLFELVDSDDQAVKSENSDDQAVKRVDSDDQTVTNENSDDRAVKREDSETSSDEAPKTPEKTVSEPVVLRPQDPGSCDSTDEDRLFCLSLVQPFKRIDYRCKMRAKIEVLKVIHNFSNRK